MCMKRSTIEVFYEVGVECFKSILQREILGIVLVVLVHPQVCTNTHCLSLKVLEKSRHFFPQEALLACMLWLWQLLYCCKKFSLDHLFFLLLSFIFHLLFYIFFISQVFLCRKWLSLRHPSMIYLSLWLKTLECDFSEKSTPSISWENNHISV